MIDQLTLGDRPVGYPWARVCVYQII